MSDPFDRATPFDGPFKTRHTYGAHREPHDARKPRKLTWAAECRDADPPKWVVKGVVAENNLFVCYGAPKTTKSFITLDMALHVATGREWFGRKVRKGGVLIVCAERAAVTKRRLDAIQRYHNVDDPDIAIISGSFAMHTTPADVQDVVEAGRKVAERAGSLRLIIVDTLARANAGADDVSDMPAILGPLAKLQDEFPEAAIVPIHHSNAEEGSRKMRGRSDLRGAIDGALFVEKTVAGSVATLVDSNDAADGFEAFYRIQDVQLGNDEDGDPFGSGVVVPSEMAAKTPKRKVLAGRDKVALEALREVIRSDGIVPSSPHFPEQKRVVPVEKWRSECDRRELTESDERDTHRRAFNRSKIRLIDADFVQVYDDFAWLTEDAGTSGTKRDTSRNCPGPSSGTDGTGTIVPVPSVPVGEIEKIELLV